MHLRENTDLHVVLKFSAVVHHRCFSCTCTVSRNCLLHAESFQSYSIIEKMTKLKQTHIHHNAKYSKSNTELKFSCIWEYLLHLSKENNSSSEESQRK